MLRHCDPDLQQQRATCLLRAVPAMYTRGMRWNWKQYGASQDPIHKSHLNDITGEYGCPARFAYSMHERASSGGELQHRDSVSGKAAAGTAAHETIARALGSAEMRAHLLGGGSISRERVRDVFAEELQREAGGRAVEWYDADSSKLTDERVEMVTGLLNDMHRHVAEVLLIEPGFIAPRAGYWLAGHIDMVYRPRTEPERVALADWKTGAMKPASVELDHGWEAGVYSAAVRYGLFLMREQIDVTLDRSAGQWVAQLHGYAAAHASRYIAERVALERALTGLALSYEVRSNRDSAYGEDMHAAAAELRALHIGQFPSQIYHVHLADYVPYKRDTTKAVKRAEDVAFYGLEGPVKSRKCWAGEQRGPAWLPVQLAEYDVPRLERRLRNVVGMVRLGRFVDHVGERCTRCAYRDDCLNSGYDPAGEERVNLERTLTRLSVNDTDLSVDD